MKLSVLEYPDVEAALDAADDGDTIYFPGMALYMPSVDDNGADANATQGQILFLDCSIARVDTGQIEKFAGKTVAEGCTFDGSGGAAIVEGANFIDDVDPPDAIGVVARGEGPVAFMPCRFKFVRPALVHYSQTVTNAVVLPQFNSLTNLNSGAILLPPTNNGLMSEPFVVRDHAPAGNDMAGLIVPAGSADPSNTLNTLQDGMIFYRLDTGSARIRVAGGWKGIALETP